MSTLDKPLDELIKQENSSDRQDDRGRRGGRGGGRGRRGGRGGGMRRDGGPSNGGVQKPRQSRESSGTVRRVCGHNVLKEWHYHTKAHSKCQESRWINFPTTCARCGIKRVGSINVCRVCTTGAPFLCDDCLQAQCGVSKDDLYKTSVKRTNV
eukprot:TRINITY_DN581_c0_g1_i2.p2 TRINITY_DN581_c0_g1~~TRINITY_DN581_c0_g1_i2.p2  ORF type:complete len:153 (+),score=33.32 TRINITY_DN581_c0_g1_i2:931-1389(+)